MPPRRPATRVEYDNMTGLTREWYLNGLPILLTAKDGVVRSMISHAIFTKTAGQGPRWSLHQADAILVRPQGYRDRESDDPKLSLCQQPDYVDPYTIEDLSPFLQTS